MLRGRLLLLASLSALAVAAPAMAGKKVPSAEQGALLLMIGAPQGFESLVTVRPGQVAWREDARPERNVRLLDPAPERKRPQAPGVPAGTVLFGYKLRSGVAYCPTGDLTRGVVTVQCFRDFNRDGKFEGGYVSGSVESGSQYLAGWVQGLGAAANMRYERVAWQDATPVPTAYRFAGFRGGMPHFRLVIDNVQTDTTHVCTPAADGACEIAGLTLKVQPQGDGASISLVSAEPDRQLQINMSGLSLPGPKKLQE